jgi:hypothetical protein
VKGAYHGDAGHAIISESGPDWWRGDRRWVYGRRINRLEP